MLGAQLGVVAVRFDLYDRASNGAADGYERPACEVGSGIKFDNPRATEKARGAPAPRPPRALCLWSDRRRRGTMPSVTRTHESSLELGARDRRFSRPQSSTSILGQWIFRRHCFRPSSLKTNLNSPTRVIPHRCLRFSFRTKTHSRASVFLQAPRGLSGCGRRRRHRQALRAETQEVC